MPLKSGVRAVDALGALTIVAYGTWFYGFGVLVGDVGDDLGVGVGALGVVYGLTTLAGGIGAMFVGRLLDQVRLDLIFLCLGPAAAATYAVASFASNFFVFAILYVVAGGGIAATGFYSVTQPLVVQLRADDPMRGITRLTIWGAFSSPIAIPLTELARDATGWRTAVRLSAAILVVAYFGAGWLARGRVTSAVRSSAKVWTVAKETTATPLLRCYVAAAFFSSMAVAVLLVYQVQTMKWAGLSAAAAASFAGARGLLQLLGRLPLLPLVDRFGSWKLQHVCRGGVAVGAVALVFSGRSGIAIVYAIVVGTSAGALSALDGMVGHEVLDREHFATALAFIGFVATVGSATGPIVAGILVQRVGSVGVAPGFVIVSASVAVILQVMAAGHRRRITVTSV